MAVPGFGFIVDVVAAAWELSLIIVPAAFLVSLLGYLVTQRGNPGAVNLIVSGQRDTTLLYGPYLIAGFFLGGALLLVTENVIVGGVAAVLIGLSGVLREERPAPAEIVLGRWREWVHLPWLVVPLLAAAALLTGNMLLQSVVALIFYTAVFWEI